MTLVGAPVSQSGIADSICVGLPFGSYKTGASYISLIVLEILRRCNARGASARIDQVWAEPPPVGSLNNGPSTAWLTRWRRLCPNPRICSRTIALSTRPGAFRRNRGQNRPELPRPTLSFVAHGCAGAILGGIYGPRGWASVWGYS